MDAGAHVLEERKIDLYLAVLIREHHLLGQFLDLQQEKKQYIVLAKPEQLDKANQMEGSLVSDLEKTEGARFKLQGDFAAVLGLPPEELTAQTLYLALLQQLPEKASRLRELTDQIQEQIVRIKEVNEENSQLLNVALDYIAEMQWMLTGQETAGTYSHDGDVDGTPPVRTKIIDAKA